MTGTAAAVAAGTVAAPGTVVVRPGTMRIEATRDGRARDGRVTTLTGEETTLTGEETMLI